jgi:hypothetical protein
VLSGKPCISTTGTPIPAVISACSSYCPRGTVKVRLVRSIKALLVHTGEQSERFVAAEVWLPGTPPAGWQPPCSRSVAAWLLLPLFELVRHHARAAGVIGRHPKVDSRVETVGVVWPYRGKPDGRRTCWAAAGDTQRRSNLHRSVRWSQSVVAGGSPAGFHFHDLRHTGNSLAAASGASTRKLMHRMGHGSMRAALIYQHATSQRDREIADALQKLIEREIKCAVARAWPGAPIRALAKPGQGHGRRFPLELMLWSG